MIRVVTSSLYLAVLLSFSLSAPSLCISISAASEELNAAQLYRRAGTLLSQLPEDFSEKASGVIAHGWSDPDNSLGQLLIMNQEAMHEFATATQQTYCQFVSGPIRKDMSAEMPQYVDQTKIARLLLMQGTLYESEGRLDAAAENYVAVLKFANHLGKQDNFILLGKLMEIILKQLTYPALERYLKQEKTTAAHYRYMLEALVSLRQQNTDLARAFEEDKEILKSTIEAMEEGAKKRRGYNERFYQALRAEFASAVDELFGYIVMASQTNEQEIGKRKISEFTERVKQEAKPWNLAKEMLLAGKFPEDIAPGVLARIVVSTSIPQFSKLITKYYVSLAEFDAVIAAVAIRAYELENGRSVDNLQELVPGYMPGVPTDPFNSFSPLTYEKNERGWVLYSIGPDRVDDHGILEYQGEGAETTGDIVVSSI